MELHNKLWHQDIVSLSSLINSQNGLKKMFKEKILIWCYQTIYVIITVWTLYSNISLCKVHTYLDLKYKYEYYKGIFKSSQIHY
jgi:hypothetical protein